MHQAQPSRTAQRVAMRRAAHQLLDDPRVFDDPLAVAIADGESERPTDAQQPLLASIAGLPRRAQPLCRRSARASPSNAAFANT